MHVNPLTRDRHLRSLSLAGIHGTDVMTCLDAAYLRLSPDDVNAEYLDAVATVVEDLSPEKRARVLLEVFGSDAIRAVVAILAFDKVVTA